MKEKVKQILNFSGKLKDIPILILSALNEKFPLGFSSNDIDEYWLPVEDFLEKPVDLDILKEKVSRIISKGKSKTESFENKTSI